MVLPPSLAMAVTLFGACSQSPSMLLLQVEEEPGELRAACQALQSFIHRVSLLRPKVIPPGPSLGGPYSTWYPPVPAWGVCTVPGTP